MFRIDLSKSVYLPLCFCLALVSLSWLMPNSAIADCPDGDPCVNLTVYRLQGWPVPYEDAKGREMISLQEANANNSVAARAFLASKADHGTSIVIQSNVIMMNQKPLNYCNCNFEHDKKGCQASLAGTQEGIQTFLNCVRSCFNGGDACTGSGLVDKEGGGIWYSFPVSTMFTEGGNARWMKNAFGVDARNRDWMEEARVVKRANCIAGLLRGNDELTLEEAFTNESCDSISEETLREEAIPRE